MLIYAGSREEWKKESKEKLLQERELPMIIEIILFQIVAVIIITVSCMKGKKGLLNIFFGIMLVFCIVAVPYLVKGSVVTAGQKYFCSILYALILILGTLYIVRISNKSFCYRYRKRLPIVVKDEYQIQENSVLNKEEKRRYFSKLAFMALLLLWINVIAVRSWGNIEFLHIYLDRLLARPLVFYGIILSAGYIATASMRDKKSIWLIVIFVFGSISYAVVLDEVKNLEMIYRILIYCGINIFYFVGCHPNFVTKLSIGIRAILNLFAVALLIPDINEKLVNFIVEKKEYYNVNTNMASGLGILSSVISAWLVICGIYYAFNREASQKYLTLYILEKRYASYLEGVDSDGNIFRNKKIRGMYCLVWTDFDVYSGEKIRVLEELERTMNINRGWQSCMFVIETDAGWYYCRNIKNELVRWNGIQDMVEGDWPKQIKIQIINKKEMEYLDPQSMISRLYHKKCGNRDCTPVLLDANFLQWTL